MLNIFIFLFDRISGKVAQREQPSAGSARGLAVQLTFVTLSYTFQPLTPTKEAPCSPSAHNTLLKEPRQQCRWPQGIPSLCSTVSISFALCYFSWTSPCSLSYRRCRRRQHSYSHRRQASASASTDCCSTCKGPEAQRPSQPRWTVLPERRS